jgi:hypothetical protein
MPRKITFKKKKSCTTCTEDQKRIFFQKLPKNCQKIAKSCQKSCQKLWKVVKKMAKLKIKCKKIKILKRVGEEGGGGGGEGDL